MKQLDDYLSTAGDELEYRKQRGELIVTAASGQSMRPTIITGDRIVIDQSEQGNFREGDIIAFRKEGMLICHRIKEVCEKNGEKSYTTMGDSHANPDRFDVRTAEIAGRVVRVIRRSGYMRIASYAKSILGQALQLAGISPFAKTLFFLAVKNNVEYRLLVPIKEKEHPAFMFAGIVMDDISNKEKPFFLPLDSMATFRVAAYFRNSPCGFLEVRKKPAAAGKDCCWRVEEFRVPGIFRGTRLAGELLGRGRFILRKLDACDIYIQIPPAGHLFTCPFRALTARLFLILQGFPLYRKLAGKVLASRTVLSVREIWPATGDGRSILFTAELWGKVIGSASLVERIHGHKSCWWITGLKVSEIFRGAGAGSLILKKIIFYADETNVPGLNLAVNPKNLRALLLYERLGFVKTGECRGGRIHMKLTTRGKAKPLDS